MSPITHSAQFLRRWEQLTALTAIAAPSVFLNELHERKDRIKGHLVTWATLAGDAQYSYLTGNFSEDGLELEVFGGCAEESPEFVDPTRILGQCRVFILLQLGWSVTPDFDELAALAREVPAEKDDVPTHGQFVDKLFAPAPGAEVIIPVGVSQLSFFDEEGNYETFVPEPHTNFKLCQDTLGHSVLIAPDQTAFVIRSIDFDSVNAS